MTEDRRIKWERTLEWPLTLAAVLFLVAYAVPILRPDVDPSLPDLIVTLTWVAFGVDYIVRFVLSGARWRFVRQHPLDLLVIALPILRPLRLLRLVALLSVLNRYASGGALRGRVVLYIVGSTALLILVSSLAILDAERGREGANIEDYGDAAWWAITTMTTVGYGDRFPVTGTGRPRRSCSRGSHCSAPSPPRSRLTCSNGCRRPRRRHRPRRARTSGHSLRK
ncbi:MAG: potassium channel family protein [Mycobacteriales bacterium]